MISSEGFFSFFVFCLFVSKWLREEMGRVITGAGKSPGFSLAERVPESLTSSPAPPAARSSPSARPFPPWLCMDRGPHGQKRTARAGRAARLWDRSLSGSLGRTARSSNQSILMESTLNIHWKDWCWSWNSNTLAAWRQEPTHWKRPWCWGRLKAEGEDRGWGGWMASLTQWTWVWASSRRWWKTGRPGVLQSLESRRVGHDWATEQQQQIYLLLSPKVHSLH